MRLILKDGDGQEIGAIQTTPNGKGATATTPQAGALIKGLYVAKDGKQVKPTAGDDYLRALAAEFGRASYINVDLVDA